MSRVLDAELPARWSRRQRWKNTMIFWLLRAVYSVVRWSPFLLARTLATILGRAAFWVAIGERRRAEKNLARALPELNARQRRAVTRQMFGHLAISAVEVVHAERFLDGRHHIDLSGESRATLDAALARGNGVVAVAGHIGNWELMAHVVASAGYPIAAIAKPLYDPRLTRWVHRLRTAWGQEILWRGEDDLAERLDLVFRGNRILGLLIDQDTKVHGEWVPFFGIPAHTPSAPASLALKYSAPIVVITSWRDGYRHHIEVEEISLPTNVSPKECIHDLTASLNRALELAIRRHPSQWVWLHDRWKRSPPA